MILFRFVNVLILIFVRVFFMVFVENMKFGMLVFMVVVEFGIVMYGL